MPRNPTTGVYEAPENSWNPAVAGTVIDPEDWNATQGDYVDALNGVVLAGQPQTLTDEQKEQARENTDAMGMSVTPGQHHFVVYDTATGKFIDSGATSRFPPFGWGHFGDYTFWSDQYTYPAAYQNSATLAGVSNLGGTGVLGYSRTSDDPNGTCIGGNFESFNDGGLNKVSWAIYGESYRYDIFGAGRTFVVEYDITEFGTATEPNPYQITNLTTAGIWMASGGDHTIAHPAYNPVTGLNELISQDASLAMGIINNGAKFKTGIAFADNALTGADGTDAGGEGSAIKFARNHLQRWYATGALNKFSFGSKATAAATSNGLFYTDNGLELWNTSNNAAQVRLTAVSNGVNGINIAGNVTTGRPVFQAIGSDTDIGLFFKTKGAGTFLFSSLTGSNFVQMDGASTAVNYLRLSATATGAGPFIQPLGTDTDIDVQILPKGAGLLKSSGSFAPASSGGASIGTVLFPWLNTFLASGSVTNWDNGDVTLTHSANTLTYSGANTYSFKSNLAADLLIVASSALFSTVSMVVNSSTAVPAGGATTCGYKLSSTASLGFFVGTGAPTLSAAKGSIYSNTTATTTTTRLYVNTDGAATWTNLTTAA